MSRPAIIFVAIVAMAFSAFLPDSSGLADDRQGSLQKPAEGAAGVVSHAEILDRIERFGSLSAESAELVLAGLKHMDHPMARLENGLLLIYGPASHRDLPQGISELTLLLDSGAEVLMPEAKRVIGLVVEHARQLSALVSSQQASAEMLAELRESNLLLREKLDALRQIDETLESGQAREDENSQPGGSDQGRRQ